jgi:hypothetical protein
MVIATAPPLSVLRGRPARDDTRMQILIKFFPVNRSGITCFARIPANPLVSRGDDQIIGL